MAGEDVGGGRRLKPLVKQALSHIGMGMVLADGAYDSKRGFRLLSPRTVSSRPSR